MTAATKQPQTIAELYNARYLGSTVAAHLTDGRTIRDISRNDDGSYYLWTDHGELSSDGERMVITHSATQTYASFPCPDCHKLISSEGRDIHLCVTRLMDGRKVLEVSREYVGHYDGYRVCGMPDNHAVEIELDRYIADLQAAGLNRTATELDGGDPEAETPIDPTHPQRTSVIPVAPVVSIEQPSEGDAALDEACEEIARSATRSPAVPIPVAELHRLRGTNTAAFRARLAGLSPSDLDTEARVYAAYDSLISHKVISAEQTLAYFRQQMALHHSGAVPQAPQHDADEEMERLFEFAVTDLAALAAMIGAYSETQRERLAWRLAAWLRSEHGIVKEPAVILRGWALLSVGMAASGMAGLAPSRASEGAQQCAAETG